MKIIKKTLDIGSVLQSSDGSNQYKVTREYIGGNGAKIIVYQIINEDGTLDKFQYLAERQTIEEGIQSNRIKLI